MQSRQGAPGPDVRIWRWSELALNIKSDEAHRLAKQLAEMMGTFMTAAVTSALKRTLSTETQSRGRTVLLAEVAEIQKFVADLPDRDLRCAEEIVSYDDTGLPG